MLPHATRKDPRLQHSNEQLGHAIAIMPARIEKNKNFMNVTNRVLQCCAVVKNYDRKNAKLAWTTPFVPDTFIVPWLQTNFPLPRPQSHDRKSNCPQHFRLQGGWHIFFHFFSRWVAQFCVARRNRINARVIKRKMSCWNKCRPERRKRKALTKTSAQTVVMNN